MTQNLEFRRDGKDWDGNSIETAIADIGGKRRIRFDAFFDFQLEIVSESIFSDLPCRNKA
ncbi:hypothetical protein [Burkholderia gladioli]|uniref:hypothetical protein n=1 Tax=Burkholderia gladioli TaxID=28095 RepID=UPI001640BBB4|nr:hypothetical protein [Burkholderia gladioli]MDC6130265.1 hypothetical protein [Burkholderia gladioli]